MSSPNSLYSNYADYNEPLNKIDAWYPGHVVEKRDGVTILDLTIVRDGDRQSVVRRDACARQRPKAAASR